MGHTATWKVLEDLMIELRKKGVMVPPNVLNDLKSAKLMIKISESQGSKGNDEQKVEEYLGSVESSLINEAQKILSSEAIDKWLRRIEEATSETSEEKIKENAFITGVPRDQKWVRIEPHGSFTSARIKQMVKENNLSVNVQKDGRMVVYGQSDDIKGFLKKMTSETNKQ
ncbi:MAG TPA: DUF2096 family protein [Candidatus Acidoferrum sp.]|nr:DUF2096 family protein [Candidatus Acidoferrum sp.]